MSRRPTSRAAESEPPVPTSGAFELVAEEYDRLMRGVGYPMWVSYYLLLLATRGFKPKRLLDIACGTGTMAEMLRKEGFHVTGVDISPAMIEVARKKAAKKRSENRFEVGDARDFDLGETFDAAYSWFDSLNNILQPEGLLSAFRRAHAHIRPGGSWIFDLNLAYAFEKRMFDQKNRNPSSHLQYEWKGSYDKATRIIEVDMRFWKDGEPFREIHRQRAYSVEEVLALLEEAGFEEVRSYHSYTLNPLRPTSDRAHFVCERP